MKNIKKLLIPIGAFMLLCSTARAQKGTLKLTLDYNYAIPTGAFNSDLVSNGSPRGGRGAVMYSFTDRFSAGLESGYQDYYEKFPRDLYHFSNTQDVSAVLTNSIQTTPFLAKAKYALSTTAGVKPYISLGAGANMISFHQYFGEFSSGQSDVGFIAEGGLGIAIPFSKDSEAGVNIGATYDYAPYTNTGYDNLNVLNVRAGVVIPIH